MYKFEDYKIEVTPLSKEDGGGFLITFPDLPGCMADGETIEEAIHEARSAFQCWVEACIEWKKEIPAPGSLSNMAIVIKPAQNLYTKLCTFASRDGKAIDAFVVEKLAEVL